MKNGARALPAAIATELVALYGAAKWAQLVTAANRVTTQYPKHLLGWQASGKALLQLGKVPEAIEMPSSSPRFTVAMKAGERVLSPSETRLMPLTPISEQSSRNRYMTSRVMSCRSFSWSMA